MKITREKALAELCQGLSSIAYYGGETCTCGYCRSCKARGLLIRVEPDGDLGRALSSPCACDWCGKPSKWAICAFCRIENGIALPAEETT